MPQKNKTPISVHIESTQLSWLEDVTNEFELGDISKATRVLLDYAMLEASTVSYTHLTMTKSDLV